MNYMVTEAVVLAYGQYKLAEEKAQAARRKQEEWKQGKPGEGIPMGSGR